MINLLKKIPSDKLGHLLLGLLLGLAFGFRVPLAIGVLLVAALGKELYDYLHNKITKTQTHGVELLDAVSTLIGGALGVGFVYLVHLI